MNEAQRIRNTECNTPSLQPLRILLHYGTENVTPKKYSWLPTSRKKKPGLSLKRRLCGYSTEKGTSLLALSCKQKNKLFWLLYLSRHFSSSDTSCEKVYPIRPVLVFNYAVVYCFMTARWAEVRGSKPLWNFSQLLLDFISEASRFQWRAFVDAVMNLYVHSKAGNS